MTPPDDRIRLAHLREAAEKAAARPPDVTSGVEDDEVLRLALTKLIEIVGEAAKQISEPTRLSIPGVPWSAAARMGGRQVHLRCAVHDLRRATEAVRDTRTHGLVPACEERERVAEASLSTVWSNRCSTGVPDQPSSTARVETPPTRICFFRGQMHPCGLTLRDDGTELSSTVNYRRDDYDATRRPFRLRPRSTRRRVDRR